VSPKYIQTSFFPEEENKQSERWLLDNLLIESKLYRTGECYRELLDFIIRMRNFAPFNALLLHLQKPDTRFAAMASEWNLHFKRKPKQDARPLLILWPFAPVMLVYDADDTEGAPLSDNAVRAFLTKGTVRDFDIGAFRVKMQTKRIELKFISACEGNMGLTKLVRSTVKTREPHYYIMTLDKDSDVALTFFNIVRELARLFLGHLGDDPHLKIQNRSKRAREEMETELKSAAYLVCRRSGGEANFNICAGGLPEKHAIIGKLDYYQIMRAAGQIESLLGLTFRS
jgi:hypothetical protein